MTSWSSSIKIRFLQAYRMHYRKMSRWETECKKNVPLVKQNVMKFEVFIGRQGIDQKIKKGYGGREKRED